MRTTETAVAPRHRPVGLHPRKHARPQGGKLVDGGPVVFLVFTVGAAAFAKSQGRIAAEGGSELGRSNCSSSGSADGIGYRDLASGKGPSR